MPVVYNVSQFCSRATPKAFLDAETLVLQVDGMTIDVRALLHHSSSLERVTQMRRVDGTWMSLPVARGRFADVQRNHSTGQFTHSAYPDTEFDTPQAAAWYAVEASSFA